MQQAYEAVLTMHVKLPETGLLQTFPEGTHSNWHVK